MTTLFVNAGALVVEALDLTNATEFENGGPDPFESATASVPCVKATKRIVRSTVITVI
jgi:hypothetical protein